MRVLNTFKNMLGAMIQNILTILVNFVARAIFITTLGTEYLGLNSLFTSIISMLSVAELGIASAIVYSMYKPITKGDFETIKSLMKFYRTCYRVVASIVFILGLCLIPFLSVFIESNSISEGIYIIYILFLCEAVFSYLFSYKRSIFYAHQKNYILNIMDLIYTLLLNITQIVILIFTGNFILFLMVKIIFRLVENGIINISADKKFPYLKDKKVKGLEKAVIKDLFKKVKGLLYHKTGSFIVLGTDSLIISKFLGLTTLGLYTNYNMIVNTVATLFSQIIVGATASTGDLLTENNPGKAYKIYKKLNFLNFWLFSFATISIYCIIDPFITLWIGLDYLLSKSILIIICFNFYIQGMRKVMNMFKEAAGIYYEDRYIPLIESSINLVASIILVKFFGLVGVLLGTILSSMVLFIYSYPKYVYNPLFKKTTLSYIKEQLYYLCIMIIVFCCTVGISKMFEVENNLINFIMNVIICMLVPNILLFFIFKRTEELKYFKNLLYSFRRFKSE